jgi:hypothetical protein
MTPQPADPWAAARRTVQWHIGAALLALVGAVGLLFWAWWPSGDGGDHAFAGGFGVFFTCVTALALSLYVSASRRVRDGRRRGLWQTLATTLVLLASAAPLTRRAPVFLALLALLAGLELWVLLDRIRATRTSTRG